ncbi:hypothetical protein D3C72_1329500 [compost metagenome]
MDQRAGARVLQPLAGSVGVHVGPEGGGIALAVFALCTDGAGEGAALFQWAREECGLPFGRAHLGAKLEVVGVFEAERVAMAQQPAFAVQHQHRGVVEQGQAALRGKGLADEEVAVAVHEEHRHALRGALQQFGALRLEAGLGGGIVAHPHLEQVAEDDQRIGRRGLQVALPGLEGGQLAGLQVQVGNQVDGAPRGRRHQLGESRVRHRGHAAAPCLKCITRQ